MKATIDKELDVAYIKLKKGKVVSTKELSPGLNFDFDRDGNVLGIEVLSVEKIAPLLKKKDSEAS